MTETSCSPAAYAAKTRNAAFAWPEKLGLGAPFGRAALAGLDHLLAAGSDVDTASSRSSTSRSWCIDICGGVSARMGACQTSDVIHTSELSGRQRLFLVLIRVPRGRVEARICNLFLRARWNCLIDLEIRSSRSGHSVIRSLPRYRLSLRGAP